MIKAMAKCIRNIWKGDLPEEWRAGIVKPIYKKEDIDKMENYRGITLMDTGYKIYVEWIKKKLEKEREEKEILDRTQFGFRRGKGTMEAVFILSEIIEEGIRKEKGKIFVCFTDLKAAFDLIKRQRIWEILRKKEVQEKMVKKLEEIYDQTIAKIKVENSR